MTGILRIYNVRYIIDSRGLEAQVGILSPKRYYQRRIFFSDIRSAESEQTVVERFLNVGAVEIGTAGTSGVEIVFQGVSAPQELRGMIQRERDRSLRAQESPAGPPPTTAMRLPVAAARVNGWCPVSIS